MKTVLALLFFAFCFSLFSCYSPRYVYSPSAHNVPVFLKKGDSKLAFNYSFNIIDNATQQNAAIKGKDHGYDLQSAYAISNHWALQLNYSNRAETNTGDFNYSFRDSAVINYNRNLTEIGAGYFKALNDNKQAVVQIFAGIGFGKFGFTDEGRDQNNVFRHKYHNMNITKLFIQPAFTVKSKKNFAATFSSKNSLIFFSKISTNYSATELDNYKLDSLSYSPRFFWEPAIINTFGFKKLPGIQFEFQMGMAFLMSRRFVDYRAFNFSAGLLFDLPKLFALNKHSSKN
ncbi:MAG: hypothetical protein RIR31_1571 [Bacteroidota bacterium]|jgi:hypothetical protein